MPTTCGQQGRKKITVRSPYDHHLLPDKKSDSQKVQGESKYHR